MVEEVAVHLLHTDIREEERGSRGLEAFPTRTSVHSPRPTSEPPICTVHGLLTAVSTRTSPQPKSNSSPKSTALWNFAVRESCHHHPRISTSSLTAPKSSQCQDLLMRLHSGCLVPEPPPQAEPRSPDWTDTAACLTRLSTSLFLQVHFPRRQL